MSTPTIEERLSAVEAQVEVLKQQAKADKSVDKSDDNIPWWQRIVGIHADSPGFEEAVRLGREWRESEDPEGIEGTT